VVSSDTEHVLLNNVLDALDNLYDRRELAEWWLEQLVLATSVAMAGTRWETLLSDAANALNRIRLGSGDYDAKNAAALDATGDLRHQLAEAL
jgi:hypothetical protein